MMNGYPDLTWIEFVYTGNMYTYDTNASAVLTHTLVLDPVSPDGHILFVTREELARMIADGAAREVGTS